MSPVEYGEAANSAGSTFRHLVGGDLKPASLPARQIILQALIGVVKLARWNGKGREAICFIIWRENRDYPVAGARKLYKMSHFLSDKAVIERVSCCQ